VDSEKDLSRVFYRDDVVKEAKLIASKKPAPLQGEAGTKSAVEGLKKESHNLQRLPAAKVSESAKAPLQGEAGTKSAVEGLKKESQNLQRLPAAKVSESAKEDIEKKKKKDRRQRRRKQWDPGIQGLKGDPIPLKINLPVFSPSLPKSGTTSIWQYFNCKCGNTSRREMTFRTPFSPLSLSLHFLLQAVGT
jgi:hypothetical protein